MENFKPIPKADIEALRTIDTATVCNVIELFDVRPRSHGYMDSRIRSCFPAMPPMVGYATTGSFRSSAPGPSDAYEALEITARFIEQLGEPTVVVFQDLDDPPVAATFGEVMCSTYQAFGGQGLITSGTGRDLAAVEEFGFPVFTNGTTCAHGYCHTVHLNEPVRVGGLVVNVGDLLHGDANGVTSVPTEIASAVVDHAAPFVALEEELIAYNRSGNAQLDGVRDGRAEFRRKLDELTKKIRAGR